MVAVQTLAQVTRVMCVWGPLLLLRHIDQVAVCERTESAVLELSVSGQLELFW